MYDKRSECAETSTTGKSCGATFSDDDMVFERWIDIAAVAWEGFQFSGPGGVCLREVDGEPRIAYHPGAVCNCHPVDASTYDPQRQVLIFTAECKPVLLEGWPAPPEALKMFDVEIEELIARCEAEDARCAATESRVTP